MYVYIEYDRILTKKNQKRREQLQVPTSSSNFPSLQRQDPLGTWRIPSSLTASSAGPGRRWRSMAGDRWRRRKASAFSRLECLGFVGKLWPKYAGLIVDV